MSESSAAPFVSRFYRSADGLDLHYRDYAGPPDAPFTVLCIPGLTRNARDFEVLAPHLAQRYRVLCVELRGRGLSAYAKDPMTYVPPTYVRDVMALLKAERLRRVAFIGTSLGGLVSTVLTSIMPQRVLGIIVNDIGPEIDAAGLKRIGSYLGKAKPILSWDDAAEAIKAIDGVIYPDYTAADWQRMGRRRFRQEPDGSFRADYDLDISKPFASTNASPDLWPYFRRLRGIPAMVLRGANSDLLAAATVDRMRHEIPGLQAVEVPNRGHTPNLDEPVALSAIDRFLANLPHRNGPLTSIARTLSGVAFMTKLALKGAGGSA